MRSLDVYLLGQHCGQLVLDSSGQMVFTYGGSWLSNPNASPISQSLPLRSEPFHKRECSAFFGGILPEQRQRIKIASNLGISAKNDFAMLELIGGECAGAVSLLPSGSPPTDENPEYRLVNDQELAEIIRALPQRPLLAGEPGIRLSLAGAQSKLAVCVHDGVISIPLGGAPSSHILKPANSAYPGLVANEAYCMQLAKSIGLPTANVSVHKVEGIEFLLVERYDRREVDGTTIRLHQEDFCQALWIDSEMKYQNEGGPSFAHSFDLLRRVSSAPLRDLQGLLNIAIFNFLIGNHDAHGKNFSLLYQGKDTYLAPFYDLLSTVYYPELSPRMAMKIGSEYDPAKVLARHFEKFADDAGLSRSLTLNRVLEIASLLIKRTPELEQDTVSRELGTQIRIRCETTLTRLAKGHGTSA